MSRVPKAFVAVSGLAVLGATLAVAGIAVHEPGAIAAAAPRQVPNYGNLPIRFEVNVGQAPAGIEYLARGNGYTVALTQQAAILGLHPVRALSAAAPPARLRLSLLHAQSQPRLRPERQQTSVSNYFVGSDPSKWHSNIANYAAVRYAQVYPGIDWVVYGNPRQLEYDFVVAPRSDPRQIALRIDGAQSLSLDDNGDLLVKVRDVTLRQLKPVVYQNADDGTRHNIESRYVLTHQQVAFALGDYDHSRELIIDPSFVYSTYLGGSSFDSATAIAVDNQGNAYVVGGTTSADFPTKNPLQAKNLQSANAFIAKFNATGSALVYSTYLGGSGNHYYGNLSVCSIRGSVAAVIGGDGATAIAVDAAGNAYVAGFTNSSDFPTVNPFQATNHAAAAPTYGMNGFLVKLNAAGSALVYSTYLGGSGRDEAPVLSGDSATGIAVDAAGNAYVTGITSSPDFPTLTAFQATNGQTATTSVTAFVTKFDATGSALQYSTYLGGSGHASFGDCANGIAVDSGGNAYVVGQTSATNFPTAAAFQSANLAAALGTSDVGNAFVTKLNSTGSALVYSTYLGGSVNDNAQAVAVDASGNAYVSGYTFSSDFPTANAFQPQNQTNGHDANAFVTKFNAAGNALTYSTYLGGSTNDEATGIAVDGAGNAYIAGYAYSSDFPTVDPLQATNNGASHKTSNAFISVLDAAGGALNFSTYLGGSGTEGFVSCPSDPTSCGPIYSGDSAAAIAVDAAGSIYATGVTYSTDFPTVMAFQGTPASSFVTKISMPAAIVTATALPADPGAPSSGGGALGWELVGVLGLAAGVRARRELRRR
jgi:Beta-propeller repeat